jgi:hypothetical protein
LVVQSTLHDGSLGLLAQSGLHDGSLGAVVQSTGGVVQDASLGFALQSTGGGEIHDGSFGFVLQSTSPGGGGVVGGNPVEPEHSGAVDPCPHVPGGGGCSTVGGGSSIDGGGGGSTSNSVAQFIQGIQQLVQFIQHNSLPANTANSLTAPLNQAMVILAGNNPNNDAGACNRMNTFIAQVNSYLIQHQISPSLAAQIIQQAQAIKTTVRCS